MAIPDEEYRFVIVESYRPASTSGLRGDIHIRAVTGQGYRENMHAECSKALVRDHPVGTQFRLKARLKRKQGGRPFLYSHFTWPYEVVTKDERATPTVKPSRGRKFEFPDDIGREDIDDEDEYEDHVFFNFKVTPRHLAIGTHRIVNEDLGLGSWVVLDNNGTELGTITSNGRGLAGLATVFFATTIAAGEWVTLCIETDGKTAVLSRFNKP